MHPRLTPTERDAVARFPLILLYAFYVWRIAQEWSATGHVSGVLTAVNASLAVVLLLVRRPAHEVDHSVWAWTIGILGTVLPLLLRPDGRALAPDGVTAVLTSAGLCISIWGLASLGRSFGVVAANRGIVTGGIYRWLRHPLYAGYAVSHVGFVLAHPTAANVGIWVATEAFQVLRLLQEERLLLRDPAYATYAARVPWRVLPGIF